MTAFNFSGLVNSFDNSAEEPIQVLRHTGATLTFGSITDAGNFVDIGLQPPYFTTPTTNEFVDLLSGGDRIKGEIWVFTQVKLRAGRIPGKIEPDVIVLLNTADRYRAINTPTWGASGNFHMTLATREENL